MFAVLYILLTLGLLAGCSGGQEIKPANIQTIDQDRIATSTPPDQAESNDIDAYWDGGDYKGQPVYSLSQGISHTARDFFAACGLGDSAIENAVTTHMDNPDFHIRGFSKQGFVAQQGKDRETLWSVSIQVTSLTDSIYLVTCDGKRP